MKEFFRVTLYQPLYNLFILIAILIPNHNVGLAIIILTLLVRVALIPLKNKSIESQIKQQELQPELKKLQAKYKDDKVGLSAAQMQLYKDKGVNPASGCLPLLIQLPILIVLYFVFRAGLGDNSGDLYPFIKSPENLQTGFLWVKDLTQRDSTYILPVLAGVAQFLFSRSIMSSMPARTNDNSAEDMAMIINKQMMYLAPAMTVLIARNLPAGLSLYWVVASLADWYLQIVGTRRYKQKSKGKVTVSVREKKG